MPNDDLTTEEDQMLKALVGADGYDRDTTAERVLINRGFAERFGMGRMRITDAGREFLDMPTARQRKPITVSVNGDDPRDVDEAIRNFITGVEAFGATIERRGNMVKVFPPTTD